MIDDIVLVLSQVHIVCSKLMDTCFSLGIASLRSRTALTNFDEWSSKAALLFLQSFV